MQVSRVNRIASSCIFSTGRVVRTGGADGRVFDFFVLLHLPPSHLIKLMIKFSCLYYTPNNINIHHSVFSSSIFFTTSLCFYSLYVVSLSPSYIIFTFVLSQTTATCRPCSLQTRPSPTPMLQTMEPVAQSTTTHSCPTKPAMRCDPLIHAHSQPY